MPALVRLDPSHRLHDFDSGSAVLDDWLRGSAVLADRKRTARTYVWLEGNDVVGYVAISPHIVERAALPSRLGRGDPAQVPALLLGKLALDRRLHGTGRGSDLLVDALLVMVTAADVVGGRYLVVDAIDDVAAEFYRHHDFRPGAEGRRLFMRVADARISLGLEETT